MGQRIICAGLLAEIYSTAGGKVIQRGKPDPAIYAPTLALLETEKARTLAVGDSPAHRHGGREGSGDRRLLGALRHPCAARRGGAAGSGDGRGEAGGDFAAVFLVEKKVAAFIKAAQNFCSFGPWR